MSAGVRTCWTTLAPAGVERENATGVSLEAAVTVPPLGPPQGRGRSDTSSAAATQLLLLLRGEGVGISDLRQEAWGALCLPLRSFLLSSDKKIVFFFQPCVYPAVLAL